MSGTISDRGNRDGQQIGGQGATRAPFDLEKIKTIFGYKRRPRYRKRKKNDGLFSICGAKRLSALKTGRTLFPEGTDTFGMVFGEMHAALDLGNVFQVAV